MIAIIFIEVWVLGLLMGAGFMTVYLYWQLATGRRVVRPWNEVVK